MKRIKTKQEFINEFGTEFKGKTCMKIQGKMDYLFGCVLHDNWVVTDDMLTTNPHPYAKGNWVVKVNHHDGVQAKALAIGLKWGYRGTDWFDGFTKDYLKIRNGTIGHADVNNIDKHILLTQQQFMDGDVPSVSCNDENTSDKYMCVMTQGNRAKYFTATYGDSLIMLSDSLESSGINTNKIDLYMVLGYKLIIEQDFMTKFPPTPPLKELKLFGHKVKKLSTGKIQVGCKTYHLGDVKAFIEIANDFGNEFSTTIGRPEIEEIEEVLNKLK